MRTLHFGSGNIGKGLIGSLLNHSGYEICFVDVNQSIVDKFNEENSYDIEILDDNRTVETISPVSALNSKTQKEKVLKSIVHADLLTTSVGANNLSGIAEIIAEGVLKRYKENRKKLNVMANENAVYASSMLKREIEKLVTPDEMANILSFVSFPNTAIDRLALSEKRDDENITVVEPDYEWIINEAEMANVKVPYIKNAIYVKDLNPYLERKLYIVNMGHAAIAYVGFLAGASTIQQALANPAIYAYAKETLTEASLYINQTFDFGVEDLQRFIKQTLVRFQNENVRDDILRVGRSPIRKLGYDERIIKPTRELFEWGFSTEYLITAIAAGMLFQHSKDEEALLLQQTIKEKGIEEALSSITKIENEDLKQKIIKKYDQLKNTTLPFM
ncbi:mannitol-1-phosphate 5-dehydrogenase [Salibacterium aidingense]|uniref:mannitol-1-phosphate 5-dehydrogenase n=1 Tax=Salibacterium aidingense TaxID=384933 RepID=UPI003BCBF7FE